MATTIISSGQSLSSQSFTDGTNITVLAGGTSTSDFVGAPGTETVYGSSLGDTVSGTVTIGTGYYTSYVHAALIAEPGSVVSGATIDYGASVMVSSGSTVSDVHVLSGGNFSIDAGAVGDGFTISGGGAFAISGVLSGFSLQNGYIGTAQFGVMISGTIGAGASAGLGGGTTGYFVVGASDVTVGSGGSLNVGLSVANRIALSGGTMAVDGQVGRAGPFHGTVLDTTVVSGGILNLGPGGYDSGTIIGSGGLEQVQATSTRDGGDVISGGTMELLASDSNTVMFAGSNGTLLDETTGAPGGVISGFNTTDRIVLAGVAADPAAKLTVSGDVATVSAGGNAYVLHIAGASALPLTLGIGTTAGTIDIGVACYCRGTSILTAEGEVAVEAIAPGDMVITADGRAEPVVWVGRRSYAGRFLAGRAHLLPIRIRAGALGRRLPRRDLLVSPNHALLLDGVLVPADALVDGRRITVERGCAQVEYFRVELARHDVILAEAAAETFLDDQSRGMFQASTGMPGTAGSYCAPRHADGYAIEAIRRRLAA